MRTCLQADPSNADAVRTLILALTDSFQYHELGSVSRAQDLVATLPSEYERAYFAGLVAERRARALLVRGGPGRACPRAICCARRCAPSNAPNRVKPSDNDDALLRWNACARLFQRHPELVAADEERTAPVMLGIADLRKSLKDKRLQP